MSPPLGDLWPSPCLLLLLSLSPSAFPSAFLKHYALCPFALLHLHLHPRPRCFHLQGSHRLHHPPPPVPPPVPLVRLLPPHPPRHRHHHHHHFPSLLHLPFSPCPCFLVNLQSKTFVHYNVRLQNALCVKRKCGR